MPSTNHFYDLKLSCYHLDALSLNVNFPMCSIRKESNSRHGNIGQGKAILRLRQFNNEAILWRFEMAFGFIAQQTHESYGVFIGRNIFGIKASLLTHFNALETTLINSI